MRVTDYPFKIYEYIFRILSNKLNFRRIFLGLKFLKANSKDLSLRIEAKSFKENFLKILNILFFNKKWIVLPFVGIEIIVRKLLNKFWFRTSFFEYYQQLNKLSFYSFYQINCLQDFIVIFTFLHTIFSD